MTTDEKTECIMRTHLRTKLGIAGVLGLLIIGLCLLAIASRAQSREAHKTSADSTMATTSTFLSNLDPPGTSVTLGY